MIMTNTLNTGTLQEMPQKGFETIAQVELFLPHRFVRSGHIQTLLARRR